jgi:hypothetical protein
MQAPEFFDEQCLHVWLLVLRNTLGHGSLNAGEWVKFRLRDDLTDALLDKVTLGQAKGIGLGQVLLDGLIFLR